MIIYRLFVLYVSFCILCGAETTPPNIESLWGNDPDLKPSQGCAQLITGITRGLDGRIWVCTESGGVFVHAVDKEDDPQDNKELIVTALYDDHKWEQHIVHKQDKASFAIACDLTGAIWLGHSWAGVSVYDGNEWVHYPAGEGPLGGHIVSFAVSPVDGRVWMAHEAGISIYDPTSGLWSHKTPLDGLPVLEISCITCNSAGDVFLGTRYDGVYVSRSADHLSTWVALSGPLADPKEPIGRGMPSTMVNAVVCTDDGYVVVGTPNGLAYGKDDSEIITWMYARGRNWYQKVGNQPSDHALSRQQIESNNQSVRKKVSETLNKNKNCEYENAKQQTLLVFKREANAKIEAYNKQVVAFNKKVEAYLDSPDVPKLREWVVTNNEKTIQRNADIIRDNVACAKDNNIFDQQLNELIQKNNEQRSHNRALLQKEDREMVVDDVCYPDIVVAEKDLQRGRSVYKKIIVGIAKKMEYLKKLSEKPHFLSKYIHLSKIQKLKVSYKALLALPQEEPVYAYDEITENLLSHDYVTSLAVLQNGQVLVGLRQKGIDVFTPASSLCAPVYGAEKDTALSSSSVLHPSFEYASVLLPTVDGEPYVGWYGNGFSRLRKTGLRAVTVVQPSITVPLVNTESLKVIAAPATGRDALIAALDRLCLVESSPEEEQNIAFWEDDWRTRGDWLGRYGRYWANLSAMCAPKDYIWGAGKEPINYHLKMGNACKKGDSARYYVSSLYESYLGSLEMPAPYVHTRILKKKTKWTGRIRRHACWDDHSETYAMNFDGPHLYCNIRVPAGNYALSLYFCNKNGYRRGSRYRDYRLLFKQGVSADVLTEEDLNVFEERPLLAETRVSHFIQGVYKKFVVTGPIDLTFKLERNYSWCTLMHGVFLDELTPFPEPYYEDTAYMERIQRTAPTWSKKLRAGRRQLRRLSESDIAAGVFAMIEQLRQNAPLKWCRVERPVYQVLQRWFTSHTPKKWAQELAVCSYYLNQPDHYESALEQAGLRVPRTIEKALRYADDDQVTSGAGRRYLLNHLFTQTNKGSP